MLARKSRLRVLYCGAITDRSGGNVRVNTSLSWAVLALLVGVLANNFRLGLGVLTDPFHQGEYFAALISLEQNISGHLPLTIHGALDYLPGRLAAGLFGQPRYFLPTSLIYQLLNLTAAGLFLWVAYTLLKGRPLAAVALVVAAIIAPEVVDYRDTILMLSIGLYFRVQQAGSPTRRLCLEVALGVAVAVGLVWSYDRGIAAAVSLGLPCLIHCFRDKTYLLSLSVFAALILVGGLISPLLTLSYYIENVSFLMQTSAQWRYGFHREPVLLTGILALFTVPALAWLGWAVWRQKPSPEQATNALLAFLITAFVFKINTNRADVAHIFMGLWAPLLVAALCHANGWHTQLPRLALPVLAGMVGSMILMALWFDVPAAWALAALIPLVIVPKQAPAMRWALWAVLLYPLGWSGYQVLQGARTGQYAWVQRLAELPANRELATPGVVWAADQLLAAGAHCVFDMSNNGVINAVANLPTCTRLAYPVYAGPGHQAEIIQALQRQRPTAVIYSSSVWTYQIDGRAMPQRLPQVDAYLRTHYDREVCQQGYCIRHVRDLGITSRN